VADIRELLNRWAVWRDPQSRWIRHDLGFGECMSGRLLDGVRRAPCPSCVRGETRTQVGNQSYWMQCIRCMGSGYISARSTAGKINPKLIRSTGGHYPDELPARIDRLVCQLNKEVHRKARKVILQEYNHFGTPEIKAQRLKISHSNYRYILCLSIKFIEKGLTSLTKPREMDRMVI
jgi:hypothetical protein